MKKILITLLAFVILISATYAVGKKKDPIGAIDQSTTQNRVMSIENYVTLYISELSPVPEELGGRFYVTDISVNNGKGVVNYEDGHNAYVADFSYSYEDNEAIKLGSFKVRE